jgi:hypothetical protein
MVKLARQMPDVLRRSGVPAAAARAIAEGRWVADEKPFEKEESDD